MYFWEKWDCSNQFNHLAFDVQIVDLYHFMRKILEKYNWDVRLARKMLESYQESEYFTSRMAEPDNPFYLSRKSTGNWQITTFPIIKRGFPGRIQRSLGR